MLPTRLPLKRMSRQLEEMGRQQLTMRISVLVLLNDIVWQFRREKLKPTRLLHINVTPSRLFFVSPAISDAKEAGKISCVPASCEGPNPFYETI